MLSEFSKQIATESKRSYELWSPFSSYYTIIALFALLAALYDSYVARSCYDTTLIRVGQAILIIAAQFMIPIASRLRSTIPSAWTLMLAAVIPFGFGNMLVQSAACAPIGVEIHEIFVIQYITALFLLILVSGSILLTMTIWLLGSIPVLLGLLFIEHPNWNEITE